MKMLRAAAASALFLATASMAQGPLKVASDVTVKGFAFPESVGCDPSGKHIYVGNFGGTELKPAEKDGKGYISRATPDGKVVDERFLPAGGETMNKPKGIWVAGSRLWVTDIDSVWIFDTKTRKGRRLPIPGAVFANDPAVAHGALYVTDNRDDKLYRIEPADFLDAKVQPKVATVFAGRSVNPNGVFPGDKGDVLVAGFVSPDSPRAIFRVGKDGEPVPISTPIGRLDGLARLKDGTLLATDWNTGAFFAWKGDGSRADLATGFKGPADFCVMARGSGYVAYVPDLVQSHVRILTLAR